MFGLSGSKVLGLGLSLKSWAYIALAALVLGGAVFATGYGIGHGAGEASATKDGAETARKLAAKVAARELQQQEELTAANKQVHNLETENAQEVADLRAEFAAKQAQAAERDAATLSDLRAGNRRLRLSVASCSASGSAQADASGFGVDGAATAELTPATATALYFIAADGDTAIRKLTALQAWSRSAMKLCAGNQTP